MAYVCKCCGEIITDDEQELWGHIQMEHEDVFDEVQDSDTPWMLEECYEEEPRMKIGDIVTIVVDYPAVIGEAEKVKGETGVIVDCDSVYNLWMVETGKPETSGWWFTEGELRPATAEEIEAKLRFVLMERKVI